MRHTPCAAVRDEGALRMRRAPCGYCGCNLTQESPTAYKPVHPYPLPLTRTARRVVVPYECGTHPRRRARTRKGYAASVTLLRRERLR